MKDIQISFKYIAVMVLLTLLVFWPGSALKAQEAEEHNHEHEEGEMHEEDFVKLDAHEMEELGIAASIAGPAEMREFLTLTGEIHAATNRIAHLSPRFSGIVKEVRKLTGDRVEKGEVIAVIESNESLVKYKLTSAIQGTVIDMHMTIGENITDNTHSVTVADLSEVWADLRIYQEDLFSLKKGQKATVEAGGGVLETEGTIAYISPVVDEQTRTSVARVVLDNHEGKWKPGMFISARVLMESKMVDLAVPKSAIMLFEGKQVVFVRDHEGFRPQPVIPGHQGWEMVEIRSGLSTGQEYISKGAFLVKAELLKGSFGHGHSH